MTPSSAMKTTIRHNMQVMTSKKGKLPNLPPCSSTNTSVTWSYKHPRGFWSPGLIWNSRLCEEKPYKPERVTKCLCNKTVWIYGDSNGRMFYLALKGIISCRDVLNTEDEEEDKDGSLDVKESKRACENKNISVRMNYEHHDNFQMLQTSQPLRFPYNGVARKIDAISSTGSHILIVHYFLHTVIDHYGVLYKRMVELRDAVNRLLKRNPNVTVALRGPHISTFAWDINHAQGGDALAPHYLDLIREVFTDLYHKVIFLDGWGMTIGLENQEFHPV